MTESERESMAQEERVTERDEREKMKDIENE